MPPLLITALLVSMVLVTLVTVTCALPRKLVVQLQSVVTTETLVIVVTEAITSSESDDLVTEWLVTLSTKSATMVSSIITFAAFSIVIPIPFPEEMIELETRLFPFFAPSHLRAPLNVFFYEQLYTCTLSILS